MDRISTLNLNSMSIGGALKAQAQWAKAEEQQSSGLVSTDFAGLGGSTTTQVLSLEHEIEQAQTWSSEATSTGSRTQSMYTAVGNMVTQVTSLQTLISELVSSSDKSTLATQAETIQDSLVSAINKQLNGVYLFSGTNTDTAPVDLSNYALNTSSTTYTSSTADTSYYTGNDSVLSVRISSQQTVNYGVTADNSAIEEAMRAVQLVVNIGKGITAGTLDDTTATADLQSALDTATAALKDLANLQASISANASTLSSAASQQTTYVTYLQNSLSNVKDVDAAEVAAKVAAYKTQLTASYSAVSDIAQTSLAKYLS